MAHIRAQVVLQGGTNLPEDRFVNVWHFDSGAANYSSHVAAVTAALDNVYGSTDMVAAGAGLSNLLSQFVMRAYSYRFYLMSDPEPRVPTVVNKTLKPYPTTSGLRDVPEEVAIVMSLRGEAPVTPRRRGRIYFGPLNHLALYDAQGTAPVRVDATVLTSMQNALTGLMDAGVGWCIYSPTDDELVPVAGGHIDNALDTQRRRGPDASTRLLFPTP